MGRRSEAVPDERKGANMVGKMKLGRVGFVALVALCLGLGLTAPAVAVPKPPMRITCLATPAIHIEEETANPGTFDWTVNGTGACVAAQGTLTTTINGAGTSSGLGLCTGLLVQSLDITINITVTRVFSGDSFSAVDHWVAPVSTFPVATPFVIRNGDKTHTLGAGAIFTHIKLKCPPTDLGGPSDSATVAWTQNFA